MWRRIEFAKALSMVMGKEEDGYKNLLCSGALKGILLEPIMKFENEYRIWNMLVSQGLISEMGRLPYRNKAESDAAKPNVKQFLDSFAIAPEIQDEIFYLMDTVFVVPEKTEYTQNQELVNLMGWANKSIFEESKRKERQLRLEKDTKVENIVTYAVDELYIGATYEGNLPDFRRFPNLESFASPHRMPQQVLDLLPIYRLKVLSCVISDARKVSLKSDCLENLYISLGYDSDTNIPDVTIDLNGIPNLRYLDIVFAGRLNLKVSRALTNLKTIKIRYCTLLDYSWIDFMPNLEEIMLIGDKISSIEGMHFPASLQYLDLNTNDLTVITNMEDLKSLQYLSVKRNPNLTNIQQLYDIGIPTFISDQLVVRKDDFDLLIREAALQSTRSIYKLRNKPENELSYMERKALKLSYEEMFIRQMNYQLKLNFDGMNRPSDTDRKICFKNYIEKMYPYIDILGLEKEEKSVSVDETIRAVIHMPVVMDDDE